MAISGLEVWRDYVTDGVPSSGNHKPSKSDARQWASWIEQTITAFTSNGGLIYSTKAALDADLNRGANSMAWVIGDATAGNNGVYQKVGASGAGSWVRVADLPYSFIVADNAGAGTPNAIVATSSLPISGSALVLLNIFAANTGSPVTVAFNGGPVLTVKSNTGNDISPGGLLPNMLVMGRVYGSTFRLVSDQVSAAIIAQAEDAAQTAVDAAAEAVAAAAGVNLPPITPNTMLVDNAAGTARESKTFEEVRALLGPSSKIEIVPYSGIAAVDRAKYGALFATTLGRGGLFVWESTDLSAAGHVSRPVGVTTSVDSGTGIITLANHRLLTGQAVCVMSSVNGLAVETVYYAIVLSSNTFRLAASFQNTYPQSTVPITLTGTTNFTVRRLLDPYQSIYVIPQGGSITGANGAWTRHEYLSKGPIKVVWWGVNGRDPTNVDDTFAFFFALDFAEKDLRTGIGGTVEAPKGQFSIRRMLRIGQRTILKGQACYSTSLFFHSSLVSGNCIELGPDNTVDFANAPVFNHFGSYVFGACIEEMDINGGNVYRGADKSLIYTQGAHQPSHLKNLWVRGVVSYGIHWDQGLGGPATFHIEGVDVEAGTTAPTIGNKTGIMLSGAGALVCVDRVNIQGGASTFVVGLAAQKDFLNAKNLHIENCTTGVLCSQNETLKRGNFIDTITGHNSVPTLINRTNPSGNSLMAINALNASVAVTGLVVIRDNGVNKFSDTLVPFYNNA